MSETPCGCVVRVFPAEINRCPLHANAARMRELISRANNIFLVYADNSESEGLRFSQAWRNDARDLLKDTEPKP